MGTVANTPQPSCEGGMAEITYRKRRLKLDVMREAKRMRSCRRVYYEEPDLFDYAREDAELAKEFFNWLNLHTIEIGRIQRVCLERLQNPDGGDGEKEREELVGELDRLLTFHSTLQSYHDFIGEKAFYYAGKAEALDEVKQYRAIRAG